MTATLASLDPAAVGRHAIDLVIERLARLALPLSPGVTLTWRTDGDTDLGLTVADLTAWAQSGALGDWEGHEDAADALLTATEALYRAPLADGWDAAAAEASADVGRETPEDPAALALSCAWSRLRVCRGHDVTLAELARLASVTSGRVRQLVTASEIAATAGAAREPSTVTAAEARRWLASRGLRGW